MSDSTIYIGHFKDDIYHGKGTLYFPDGKVFEGLFVNGFCYKFGKMTYKNGQIAYGEMM